MWGFFVLIKAQACKLVFVLWFVWLVCLVEWVSSRTSVFPEICNLNKIQHKWCTFTTKWINESVDLSNRGVHYEMPQSAEGHNTPFEDPSPSSVTHRSGKHAPLTHLTDLALVMRQEAFLIHQGTFYPPHSSRSSHTHTHTPATGFIFKAFFLLMIFLLRAGVEMKISIE